MVSLRGIFAGALLLIALEAVVRTNKSADRFGQLLETIAGGTERVLSPAIPAIPDLRSYQ